MSDQISEKMAREIYTNGCTTEKYLEDEDAFVYNLRAAGLIKKSALDEAREWCLSVRNTPYHEGDIDEAYRQGVLAAEARFERAITEILEERE